jgi:hypothetical protein
VIIRTRKNIKFLFNFKILTKAAKSLDNGGKKAEICPFTAAFLDTHPRESITEE